MAQSPRPRRSIVATRHPPFVHNRSANPSSATELHAATSPMWSTVGVDGSRRFGRQQLAWNANLAVARELDLLCPIAWLANRREDPARQGFNARHLDAKDGANALARVVYRGRPVVSESPRPSAASATALFRRRTMSSRILSACRVNKFDPVTQRADTRVRPPRRSRRVTVIGCMPSQFSIGIRPFGGVSPRLRWGLQPL